MRKLRIIRRMLGGVLLGLVGMGGLVQGQRSSFHGGRPYPVQPSRYVGSRLIQLATRPSAGMEVEILGVLPCP